MSTFKSRDQIINIIKQKKYEVVAIDGPTGSGKSKLATFLANALNTTPIHLDKYLNKTDKNYYKELDYNRVLRDIEVKKIVIVEGVLIKEVLIKLKIKPDLTIFCTDQAFIDEWKFYIDSEMTLDSIINERINNINVIRELEGKKKIKNLDKFHFELDKYNFNYIPFENSDFLYDYISDLVD